MRRKSVLPGLITLAISAILFYLVFADIRMAGLSASMFYITLLFTLIGIISGILTGKKIAYTMHDRRLAADSLGGKGHMSGFFGKAFDWSLWAGTFFIVGWAVFMILLSSVTKAAADEILLGYVRWISIISMALLITGSYLYFRAKAAESGRMLSFWGKRARRPISVIEEMGKDADGVEAHLLSLFASPETEGNSPSDIER